YFPLEPDFDTRNVFGTEYHQTTQLLPPSYLEFPNEVDVSILERPAELLQAHPGLRPFRAPRPKPLFAPTASRNPKMSGKAGTEQNQKDFPTSPHAGHSVPSYRDVLSSNFAMPLNPPSSPSPLSSSNPDLPSGVLRLPPGTVGPTGIARAE